MTSTGKGFCRRCGKGTASDLIKYCEPCWLLLSRRGQWEWAKKEAGIVTKPLDLTKMRQEVTQEVLE